MKLESGMTLWYVRTAHFMDLPEEESGQEVSVTSVGRKWAGLDNGQRLHLETLIVDGGQYSSPGRCYGSRKEFEDWRSLHLAWRALRKLIQWEASPPSGVTLAQIQNAMRSLFKDQK